MGKKNRGRAPKVRLDQIPKLIRLEAVEKYNKSPETVRIYFNQLEMTLIALDGRYENYEVNTADDNIMFIIGGRKNKKNKLTQADVQKAINDELELRFYMDEEFYDEY